MIPTNEVTEKENYNRIMKRVKQKTCKTCVVKPCCSKYCNNFWTGFFNEHGATLISTKKIKSET